MHENYYLVLRPLFAVDVLMEICVVKLMTTTTHKTKRQPSITMEMRSMKLNSFVYIDLAVRTALHFDMEKVVVIMANNKFHSVPCMCMRRF